MKVAVCVGGIVDKDSVYLMDKLQNKFHNYDFFFGVWKERENNISQKLNAWTFEEHEPKYRPYFDVDIPCMAQKINLIRTKLDAGLNMPIIFRSIHQTKQILMHSHILGLVPPEYDMIIRTRYDIKSFDPKLNIEDFVVDSYENNHAIGFARTLFKGKSRVFSSTLTPEHRLWVGYLMDNFICHPRKLFDRKLVKSLHENKKLLAAEFGWYQILSQPYNDNHINHFCDMKIARDK